jgi:transcription elongation GreA/GreB family factor
MGVRDFAEGDAIEASAIVEVEHEIPKKTRTTYFLVTAGGGVRLKTPSGGELLTLATTSPLGAALLGLSKEQSIDYIDSDGKEKTVEVLNILYQPEAQRQFKPKPRTDPSANAAP